MEVLLKSLRVLDLTEGGALLAGRILADLGADVIVVEKPEGNGARRIAPFHHDNPHPERSLFWFFYSANKRSITLNIETTQGQELFKKLVERADCMIESFPVGYLEKERLAYPTLRNINPRLIMASITPFGQEGPYKNFKGSEIVTMAMGGFIYLTGDPDRPPVGIGFPRQAELHAGADAAAAMMVAYHHRKKTGEGQYIDISMQHSVSLTLTNAAPTWTLNQKIIRREGGSRLLGFIPGTVQRLVRTCKDGYVIFVVYGGQLGARQNKALTEWMDREGRAPDFMRQKDWDNFDIAKTTADDIKAMDEAIDKFFILYTKAELYQWALDKHVMLYPVSNVKDLVENKQLVFRDFWKEVDVSGLGKITFPGDFVKTSEIPCTLRRRAPFIGEHNEEIYGNEIGLSKEEIIALKQAGII